MYVLCMIWFTWVKISLKVVRKCFVAYCLIWWYFPKTSPTIVLGERIPVMCRGKKNPLYVWIPCFGFVQLAGFSNPCLIQCLINSLSSCVCCSGGESGCSIYEARGSVFEVVFSRSLEDEAARGWTQAVEESNRHFSYCGAETEACCGHVCSLNCHHYHRTHKNTVMM